MFVGLGIDPLHFAIVMCVNVTVGLATPPMGLVLFVSSSVSGERPDKIALEMAPFLGAHLPDHSPDHLCAGALARFAARVGLYLRESGDD